MSVVLTKGQMKIQQMVFMLLTVTLLAVLVLLFYFSFNLQGLRDSARDLQREQALLLATRIASSPELIYEGRANSVDADKLMILKGQKSYRDFWGDVEGIIVEVVYPEQEDVVECTLETYPDCNLIKVFTDEDKATAATYVALCRKEINNAGDYDKCELARLMLEVNDEE